MRLYCILPHSVANFDRTRLLCKGAIFFSGPRHCRIAVKLPLCYFQILVHRVCVPLQPLKEMCNFTAMDSDQPLFEILHHTALVPLTDYFARKHLKKVS